MTAVLFTTDTELSPAFHRRGMNAEENLEVSIFGRVGGGEWGIAHQMARLNEHRLKGVFFVEALSSFVFGGDSLKRVVDPILDGGHEVQLHIHTEWIDWMGKDPVAGRRGGNIANFCFDDQRRLLEMGLEALVDAGAPRPIAFRAGNYGASNGTLRALHSLGVRFDASYNYVYLGTDCEILCDRPLFHPALIEGVIEMPITFFEDYPGHCRPLQLAAASASEHEWVLRACVAAHRPSIVIVSHGFELLNRDRRRANRLLARRCDAMCAMLQARRAEAPTTHFASIAADAALASENRGAMIKSSPVRTFSRVAEQALGTLVYDIA